LQGHHEISEVIDTEQMLVLSLSSLNDHFSNTNHRMRLDNLRILSIPMFILYQQIGLLDFSLFLYKLSYSFLSEYNLFLFFWNRKAISECYGWVMGRSSLNVMKLSPLVSHNPTLHVALKPWLEVSCSNPCHPAIRSWCMVSTSNLIDTTPPN
jgi:hypothetical protein